MDTGSSHRLNLAVFSENYLRTTGSRYNGYRSQVTDLTLPYLVKTIYVRQGHDIMDTGSSHRLNLAVFSENYLRTTGSRYNGYRSQVTDLTLPYLVKTIYVRQGHDIMDTGSSHRLNLAVFSENYLRTTGSRYNGYRSQVTDLTLPYLVKTIYVRQAHDTMDIGSSHRLNLAVFSENYLSTTGSRYNGYRFKSPT